LKELHAEMQKYLVGLSKTTSYTETNYAGPSGLNIPELLDLRELLKDKTKGALLTDGTKVPATEAERRKKAVRTNRLHRPHLGRMALPNG